MCYHCNPFHQYIAQPSYDAVNLLNKYIEWTRHDSPVRIMFGVCFVLRKSMFFKTAGALCERLCHNWPCDMNKKAWALFDIKTVSGAGDIIVKMMRSWDRLGLIIFNIVTICRVICVQLAHSNLGDREDIFITHFIIIIKSEISTLPIVVIFSVVVCLRWSYHHMLSVIHIYIYICINFMRCMYFDILMGMPTWKDILMLKLPTPPQHHSICITWWRHEMETFSGVIAICEGIYQPQVNSPHEGQWRGAWMFPLICAWTNGWANNRDAGDLRCHRAHYDVTAMTCHQPFFVFRAHWPTPTFLMLCYFSNRSVDCTKLECWWPWWGW